MSVPERVATDAEVREAEALVEIEGIPYRMALKQVQETRDQVAQDRVEVEHLRWVDDGGAIHPDAAPDECESCQ